MVSSSGAEENAEKAMCRSSGDQTGPPSASLVSVSRTSVPSASTRTKRSPPRAKATRVPSWERATPPSPSGVVQTAVGSPAPEAETRKRSPTRSKYTEPPSELQKIPPSRPASYFVRARGSPAATFTTKTFSTPDCSQPKATDWASGENTALSGCRISTSASRVSVPWARTPGGTSESVARSAIRRTSKVLDGDVLRAAQERPQVLLAAVVEVALHGRDGLRAVAALDRVHNGHVLGGAAGLHRLQGHA